ncbi:hypothetical protein BAY59_19905 [Prauserella coralliicola]|nr:hypothetical protein BAY59_19905 [Prauserella coralliicola]
MPSDTPEKSTSQLAVWRDLLAALDRVDVTWQATQSATSETQASAQLPGNVAVALVKASERGTRALAGIAETLVEQYDSGEPFRQVASTLRQAIDAWPTR